MLAAWIGLRLSEVVAVEWSCIVGDILHVKQAIVRGPNGLVMKGTKTYSSDRKIQIPKTIMEVIERTPKESKFVVQLTASQVYEHFSKICKELGLPHYRFHDLRHTAASVMLALGVPDKYAMERMGHATNNMLKTVYQHTMQEKRDEVAAGIDQYFEKILS